MQSTTATEIAATIESDIRAGELAAGHRLPSVRARAEELGTSPATVASAYKLLRQRGLLIGRGRQGTRVADRIGAASSVSPQPADDGLIDAANGEPDPSFLPSLDTVLGRVLALPRGRYGGPMLLDELRDEAAARFGADGIAADHLMVTSGAMDAIERALRAHDLRIGDRIGVEDPGHTPLHQMVRQDGLEPVGIPVDAGGITPAGLAAALDRGISALVVTPRAQNPTGAALTPERAEDLDALLVDHPGVLVIQDDHAGLISGVDWVALSTAGRNWVTVRSLGKAYGPDIRLALVAGDPRTIDRMSRTFANGPGWVSHVLQAMAAGLLVDPLATARVAQAEASYRSRREHLVSRLADVGLLADAGSGLNVWVPTLDEAAMVELARRAGFAIRAGSPWRLSSPPAVRISISGLTEPSIEDLAAGFGAGRETGRTSSV